MALPPRTVHSPTAANFSMDRRIPAIHTHRKVLLGRKALLHTTSKSLPILRHRMAAKITMRCPTARQTHKRRPRFMVHLHMDMDRTTHGAITAHPRQPAHHTHHTVNQPRTRRPRLVTISRRPHQHPTATHTLIRHNLSISLHTLRFPGPIRSQAASPSARVSSAPTS